MQNAARAAEKNATNIKFVWITLLEFFPVNLLGIVEQNDINLVIRNPLYLYTNQ